MIWSDWQYEDIPTTGQYVQVLAEHDITKDIRLFEGEIGGRIGSVTFFTHELPVVTSPFSAIKWRYKLKDEIKEQCCDMALSQSQ